MISNRLKKKLLKLLKTLRKSLVSLISEDLQKASTFPMGLKCSLTSKQRRKLVHKDLKSLTAQQISFKILKRYIKRLITSIIAVAKRLISLHKWKA